MHRASPRLFIYTLSPILNVNLWIPRMRILVLSDLHANVTALDAVLEAAQGRWEQSVGLGDVGGYSKDPNDVPRRARNFHWSSWPRLRRFRLVPSPPPASHSFMARFRMRMKTSSRPRRRSTG